MFRTAQVLLLFRNVIFILFVLHIFLSVIYNTIAVYDLKSVYIEIFLRKQFYRGMYATFLLIFQTLVKKRSYRSVFKTAFSPVHPLGFPLVIHQRLLWCYRWRIRAECLPPLTCQYVMGCINIYLLRLQFLFYQLITNTSSSMGLYIYPRYIYRYKPRPKVKINTWI